MRACVVRVSFGQYRQDRHTLQRHVYLSSCTERSKVVCQQFNYRTTGLCALIDNNVQQILESYSNLRKVQAKDSLYTLLVPAAWLV